MLQVLWTEDRRPYGRVFEVFGPVVAPLYSVRFGSAEGAAAVAIGQPLFYASAPEQVAYTSFVPTKVSSKRSVAAQIAAPAIQRYPPSSSVHTWRCSEWIDDTGDSA